MRVPYIGITDFTCHSQVTEMLKVLNHYAQKGSERRLHVGVMMSSKTLHGLPTKWSTVFPAKESIASIFASSEAMNCLHFADYDNEGDLTQNLISAIGWGGSGINALQLDMVWPRCNEVSEAIKQSGKEIEVILQVGTEALGQMDNDPEAVAARIRSYADSIHHVLLDKSSGKGLGMDAEGLRPFVRAIKKTSPQLGVTVAGGLGPTTLHLVEPLIGEFPDLNIDAQGKLRPGGNALKEPINLDMCAEYLYKALKLLDRNKVQA